MSETINFMDMTVKEFIASTGAKTPHPGGGSGAGGTRTAKGGRVRGRPRAGKARGGPATPAAPEGSRGKWDSRATGPGARARARSAGPS